MSKITKATFKAFLRKNEGKLFILEKSRFDGMVDCVMPNENAKFNPMVKTDRIHENNLGYNGVWLTHSGNSFSEYNQNGMKGIAVYNCCGSFVVATK